MSTVKICYVGDLAKVRMPEGCEYLTKEEAKAPDAKLLTVRKGQAVLVPKKIGDAICKSGLWKQVGKNDSTKGGKK